MPVEDLLENLEGESTIDFKGVRLSVRLLPDYKSRESTYRSRYALLNNHILVISTNGKPSPYDIKSAVDQQITFLEENGITSIDLIWNVKSLSQPGVRIRKAMIEGNKRLSPFLKSRYLIVPPKYKTLIRIFRFIYQPKVEHLFFVESVEDALCAITTGCESTSSQEVSFKMKCPAKADLLKKSKEELADMIVDYSEKHEQSTNKILEALGHISWGEDSIR